MEDDRLDIETPEHVQFSYVLAGVGSRFLAALLDIIIQTAAAGLLLVGLAVLSDAFPSLAERGVAVLLVMIGANIFIFLGYFVIFEMLWNGQTPGKRQAGLRVIRDNGTPITLTESLLRNIMRLVDFLPAYYFCGIISILFSKQSKRLGDFVAGTVVVMERIEEEPEDAPPLVGAAEQQVVLMVPLVPKLTQQEADAVEHFIERRDEVDPQVRMGLAHRLAASVRARLGTLPAGTPDQPEALLELVYAAIVRRRERI